VKPYYEQDDITIFHGKAEEVLPFVPSVDLLCTDPPYGINVIAATYQNKKTRPGAALAHKRNYCNSETWDSQPPPAWLIEQAIGKARHAIIFGGNYFELAPSSCWLVWDKENGANDFADCELIWTNLEKAVRRLKYTWNGMIQEHMGDAKEPRFHPTQKPLAVMTWAIQQAPDDCRLILDPFMGSGTTLRAAKDLGRHAIGIEQNERYCEIAAKRLAQGVLFGAGGAA
jgi:DNA modification methylase